MILQKTVAAMTSLRGVAIIFAHVLRRRNLKIRGIKIVRSLSESSDKSLFRRPPQSERKATSVCEKLAGLTYTRLNHVRKVHLSSELKRRSESGDDMFYEDLHNEDDVTEEDLIKGDKYRDYLREYYRIPDTGQRLLVVQPEIKWGPQKSALTTAELQLAEACALVDSLPNWQVVDKTVCKAKSLTTKYLFGPGTLDELTAKVKKRQDISGVFLSTNLLSGVQLAALQDLWGVPVFDRYTVVLEIFREHAKTKVAKLQVALAEIPHIRSRLKAIHDGTVDRPAGGMQHIGGAGETYIELRHRLLQRREMKLKQMLDKVKNQRKLLRENRAKKEFPVVAVVGYTNAGKTSLIKALTGDKTMTPRNELFATLDVTAHAGVLPCRMTVLYIDTVGFMSNIPTSLIDAFSATLEDALCADAIIHVRDISHPDTEAQHHNVVTTLRSLLPTSKLDSVIEVHNKADLLPQISPVEDGTLISATTGLGLKDLVREVETVILRETGKSVRYLKVPMSGPHLSWLYKEATVRGSVPSDGGEHLVVEVIISEAAYSKFKARFGRKSSAK